jgi:hypothetical protein
VAEEVSMLLSLALTLMDSASAFCGFYVSGADQSLYNDATMVVMMRSGTKTVLSMQNSYQGPPEAFALVVPVPQVLQKDNVKTLPKEIFAKVDQLAAPRLVEYWEQDPCAPPAIPEGVVLMAPTASMRGGGASERRDLGVKIEAQFEVGEYNIVILSARDSSGLDTWLRQEKYNIPLGADVALRPYVEAGTKFFVAKVIPEKVTFQDGRAVLSPLRVHYDSEQFSLPVRLGLLNSKGEQDLIVHILAPGQRYDVANYDNAFIPTNLRVRDEVRNSFGAFYDAIFREVGRPGTVVTEYAWDAGSCDPCPTPPLDGSQIATLGGDVVGNSNAYGYVLTRLHYRYGKEGLKDDLIFKAAEPVVGGRGMPDPTGILSEHQAKPDGQNQFQGRYVMLNPWKGEIACQDPVRGQWGGPPGGAQQVSSAGSRLSGPPPSQEIVLASVLLDGFGNVVPAGAPAPAPEPTIPEVQPAPEPSPRAEGEPRCATTPRAAGLAALLAALLVRFRRVS